jgi:hypothetical protein
MRSVYLAHACIYTRQLTYSRIRVVPFFEFIMRFEFLLIYYSIYLLLNPNIQLALRLRFSKNWLRTGRNGAETAGPKEQ